MPERVLLVDDEPRNLEVLEAILRPFGYELHRAMDGRRALQSVETVRPDLVLLDYAMPGLDGIDVLTHLRQHPDFRETPVVIVTAHSDREHRLRGFEAGADEFLEKPVDAAALRARVRMLLKMRKLREETRRANLDLVARNRALEQLQRDQRELVEFLVHDLKNPLSVLVGNLEFTLERLPPTTGDIRESLQDARNATQNLTSLIQDMLTVAQLESSGFAKHFESIELRDTVSQVLADQDVRARSAGLRTELSGSTRVKLEGDAPLLRRVFQNLVDNALRYAPRGGRVGIELVDGPEVKAHVSNDGPSIPPEHRDRIFDKFARIHRTPGSGNVGLGLYFCRRAVEAHGGRIAVTDKPGWGTTFTLTLPKVQGKP